MICSLETRSLIRAPIIAAFWWHLEAQCKGLVSSQVDGELLQCPRSEVRRQIRTLIWETEREN